MGFYLLVYSPLLLSVFFFSVLVLANGSTSTEEWIELEAKPVACSFRTLTSVLLLFSLLWKLLVGLGPL